MAGTTPEGRLVQCHICGANVAEKRLRRHMLKVHRAESAAAEVSRVLVIPSTPFANCPVCRCLVASKDLAKHVVNAHPEALPSELRSRPPAPSTTPLPRPHSVHPLLHKLAKERPAMPPQPPPTVAYGRQTSSWRQRREDTVEIEVECSCRGENENCYRCYGTGVHKKRVPRTSIAQHATPKSLANFASDSRGDAYSIRENGRFASAPDEDDYGDESVP